MFLSNDNNNNNNNNYYYYYYYYYNQQCDNDNPTLNAESLHQVDEGTIRAEQFEGESLTENEKAIVERLKIIMNEKQRKPLPSLKKINKKQILKEVKELNEVLKKMSTDTITTTNDLMYAAAVIVSENLGVTREPTKVRKEPWWKRRLTTQIEQMRKDLSRIERLKSGHPIKNKYKEDLQRKYWLKEKGLNHVKEVIKQRIKAKAAKIKRYNERIKQFRENQLFRTDQNRFYKELNGDNGGGESPDKEEARNFWGSIWSKDIKHNESAEWINDIKEQLSSQKQDDVVITADKITKTLSKMPNWKSPGPDFVQGFWLKNFTSLHRRMTEQLSKCLEEGDIPNWMTEGRTVLIMKDKNKGTIASNYRPITCLPLMWKLLTGLIAEEMYEFLEKNDLLPQEQKGGRKKCRGTADQLYIDQMVLKEVKRRKRNVAMAWVDYKKAYDMVPHSWLEECFRVFGIASNVDNLLVNSMKKWKTDLTFGGKSLGEVKIKRGIFQGDSLSPLLFIIALIPLSMILRKVSYAYEFKSGVKLNHLLFMDDLKLYAKSETGLDSLVQTVHMFSNDIGMEFGVEKCAVMVIRRGKLARSDDIILPDESVIKGLAEGDAYKYLGVLEAEEVKKEQMKNILKNEYKRRIRKVLQSKLNGGNTIKAINTWAVSLLRHSAPFVNWTKEEVKDMDRMTRKAMTMNGALHPRDSVCRLYVPRKMGGRGLIGIEDFVELAILGLNNYVNESQDKLIEGARGCEIIEQESTETVKRKRVEARVSEWKEKPLHGQYLRETEDVKSMDTWLWLREGTLKKETESLLTAAQDQALRTNIIKTKIDKTSDCSLCRLCKEADETVIHIASQCSKLAQLEYKARHDKVAQALHWELCRKNDLQHEKNWYEHNPQSVVENDKCKILWDFTIQTDHYITARRPDIVVVDKDKKTCQLIDVACPGDKRVKEKEDEKVVKYQDLARELRKIWSMEVKVIPIVIGVLGTIPARLKDNLKEIGIPLKASQIQKSVLLGTARILRKVLEV